MKKYFAALAAALLTMLGLSVAAPAQAAYPEPDITVTLSDQVVVEGGTFTATVNSSVNCAFTLNFDGTNKAGAGKAFSATFTAPDVSKKTVFPLTAKCDTAASAARGMAAVKTEFFTRSVNVTVVPKGAAATSDSSSSTMPNTGGPNEWLLVGGVALLAAGAGVVVASRRRAQA